MSRRGGRKNWKHLAVNKNIAKMLILHRVWNGLNQKKLSEDIGTTFQQYQKVEKCYNRIFAEQLANICKNRGWNINLFFNSNPEDLLETWNKADLIKWSKHPEMEDIHWEKDPNNDGMTKLVTDKYDKIKKLFKRIDEVAESNYFKTERKINV